MKFTFYLKVVISTYFCLGLTSSSSYYYCTLNSRGSTPLEKTYYVTSSDSTINKSLEFKEYAEILKGHLNDVGYIESKDNNAAICIVLDYEMGETYLKGTTTIARTHSSTYSKTNINSSSTANASVRTNAYANRNQLNVNTNGYGNSKTSTQIGQISNTYGRTTYGTTNSYKIPLLVSIKAYDSESREPIWEINVKDDLDRETQIQSVMPWLLLSTKEYIGKSSNGEQTVKINNSTENKEKYNLIWPY